MKQSAKGDNTIPLDVRVNYALEKYPDFRHSDNKLYAYIVQQVMRSSGHDLFYMSANDFLNLLQKNDTLPAYSTISRMRRAIQRDNPVLKQDNGKQTQTTAR